MVTLRPCCIENFVPVVSCRALDGATQGLDDTVDLSMFDGQRRRQGDDVAGTAHQQSIPEAAFEHLVAACTGGAIEYLAAIGISIEQPLGKVECAASGLFM